MNFEKTTFKKYLTLKTIFRKYLVVMFIEIFLFQNPKKIHLKTIYLI